MSNEPLRIAGPKPVIDECSRWLKPGQRTVQLIPLTAGRDVTLGRYRVRALPAAHEALGEAYLYAIAGPDATVLWATDTGPWARGVKEMLAGTVFDLVCLEETFGERGDLAEGKHHGLATFGAALAQLRGSGGRPARRPMWWRSTSATTTRRPELLYLKLRDLGARAVPDGTPIIAGGPTTSLSL